jgi:chlorophyll synthase
MKVVERIASGDDRPPSAAAPQRPVPSLSVFLELLKPITWFPPMWAFGCGAISAGAGLGDRWPIALAGILLAGPLLCGTSQAVNDWFDRHVDALNEPGRPIPSGRIPGRWGLWIACGWSVVSMAVAIALGPWVAWPACLGLVLAWAYSAPPVRLKNNGWFGNAAVGVSYEGIAWVTGTAAMLPGTLPSGRVFLLAGLYSLGAHGIMTLNDFKSVDGDRVMGVGSLPVRLGVERAARVACAAMIAPQAVVVGLLVSWARPPHAAAVAGLMALQAGLMVVLLRDPRARAAWYSATGVTLYVLGMLVSAFALRA